ncbi:dienelactone hydrolase family protein [Arenimonas fontis]|uniref:Dienelactone hydrolase family protein n=1 Tax=Arenimonas fontis TaxID=2608255 RepID=A0A5B2ZAY2_9GAMM|nr:dienelactone hydrolase family protein [Arenimonas fontis]KAA2285209.1 dienelactone hydrolase family protein [Arenimonas fontis]
MRTLLALALAAITLPAFARPVTEPVTWNHGGTEFAGYLVYDDEGEARRPGLLMVPNWMGVGEEALERARRVAGKDYVVLVADMYGKDVRPANTSEARAAVGAVYADIDTLRGRAGAALEALRAAADRAPVDPQRLAAFGFCFGGGVVLELARAGADIAAAVSFHGGLATPKPAQAGDIEASLLVLNGAEDANVPAEQVAGFQDEMRAAGADWVFVNFGKAVHCFAEPSANRPPNCLYDETASRRAYAYLDLFLKEKL